jgi:hypothetical protein
MWLYKKHGFRVHIGPQNSFERRKNWYLNSGWSVSSFQHFLKNANLNEIPWSLQFISDTNYSSEGLNCEDIQKTDGYYR